MGNNKLSGGSGTGHNKNPKSSRFKLSSSGGNNKGTTTKFEEDVREVMKELGDLLISKHCDYGPKNISESPGGPINGLRVRMWDKLARINNLSDTDSVAKHEPLEDSFKDIANYAIIGLLVLRQKWDS
jgi:hypothetical protein